MWEPLRWLVMGMVLVGASGCERGVFSLKDMSCETDVHEWYPDSMLGHLIAADASGHFDRSFEGMASVSRIVGSWDPETHAYEQTRHYPEDHPSTYQWTEGTLSALSTGDYEGDFMVTVQNVEGDLTVQEFADRREGCTRTRQHEGENLEDATTTTTYEMGAFHFVLSYIWHWTDSEQTDVVTQTSTTRADGTTSGDYQVEMGNGSVLDEERTGNWMDGHSSRQGRHTFPNGLYRDHREERWANGDRQREWTWYSPDGEVLEEGEYQVDYFGNGDGTISYPDGVTCDIEYEAWQPTCDCSDGGSGPC